MSSMVLFNPTCVIITKKVQVRPLEFTNRFLDISSSILPSEGPRARVAYTSQQVCHPELRLPQQEGDRSQERTFPRTTPTRFLAAFNLPILQATWALLRHCGAQPPQAEHITCIPTLWRKCTLYTYSTDPTNRPSPNEPSPLPDPTPY